MAVALLCHLFLNGLCADGVVCVEEDAALSADVLLGDAVSDAGHAAEGAGVGAALGNRLSLQPERKCRPVWTRHY